MVQQLFSDMRQGSIQHVDDVEALWVRDYSQRTIVQGFLKDSSLGKKRFVYIYVYVCISYTHTYTHTHTH